MRNPGWSEMTSPFDADDFMKRGLFSTIMGFKKKHKTLESNSVQSTSRLNNQSHQQHVRTPNDIFQEIVCECEHLERNNLATSYVEPETVSLSPLRIDQSHTSSPISNLTSPSYQHYEPQPTLPIDQTSQQIPSIPLTSVHSPVMMTTASSAPSPYDMYGTPFSPPPYSPHDVGYTSMSPDPVANYAAIPPPQHHLNMPAAAAHGQNIFPRTQLSLNPADLQSTHLIEGLVKMVVNALMQSSITECHPVKENPEDILRRKRQKNNEAAARYRKRQRDARGRSDGELEGLSKRNEELRHTILDMEQEIQQLKMAVLSTK